MQKVAEYDDRIGVSWHRKIPFASRGCKGVAGVDPGKLGLDVHCGGREGYDPIRSSFRSGPKVGPKRGPGSKDRSRHCGGVKKCDCKLPHHAILFGRYRVFAVIVILEFIGY